MTTESNRKNYFGASGYSDFTIHKDEQRRFVVERDIQKKQMKICQNLEQIPKGFGLVGYYGMNEQ